MVWSLLRRSQFPALVEALHQGTGGFDAELEAPHLEGDSGDEVRLSSAVVRCPLTSPRPYMLSRSEPIPSNIGVLLRPRRAGRIKIHAHNRRRDYGFPRDAPYTWRRPKLFVSVPEPNVRSVLLVPAIYGRQ